MKFKAGTYYVGDPCYVYDSGWDRILSKTDFFRKIPESHDGLIWAADTAYGDGSYEDTYGRRYLVDAGLIGIVHVALMERDGAGHGGHMITFDEPFTCREEDGVITIGHIVIDTDPQERTCWGCGEDEDWCTCDDRLSEEEY